MYFLTKTSLFFQLHIIPESHLHIVVKQINERWIWFLCNMHLRQTKFKWMLQYEKRDIIYQDRKAKTSNINYLKNSIISCWLRKSQRYRKILAKIGTTRLEVSDWSNKWKTFWKIRQKTYLTLSTNYLEIWSVKDTVIAEDSCQNRTRPYTRLSLSRAVGQGQ